MDHRNRFLSGSSCSSRRPDFWALLVAISSVGVTFGCGSSNDQNPPANVGGTSGGGAGATGGAAVGGNGTTSVGPGTGGSANVGGAGVGGGATDTGGAVGVGGAATGGRPPGAGGGAAGGNNPVTGGSPSVGGAATGGSTSAAGGKTNTGGSNAATGGSVGAGGGSQTGGRSQVGGTSSTTTTATGGTPATGGTTGAGGAVDDRPCDVYGSSTPCVAAYSMIRRLSKSYTGPLYQIRIGSSATNTGTGGTLKDVTQTADGYADITIVDSSCTGTVCTVAKLYDHSGNGNDLIRGTKGPTGNGTRSGEDDYEAVVNSVSVTAGGHKVYPLYIQQYGGYRTTLGVKAKNVPSGNTPETIYELVDGTRYGTACCWDFGNVSPDPNKYATMNTIFFGTGYWGKGAGSGPWFEVDFEGGVWAGGATAGAPGGSNGSVANTANPSMKVAWAFATIHTISGKYAIRVADASAATDLTTAYDGASPSNNVNAGGVVLGVGGDNSNNSWGTFYEGAVIGGSGAVDAATVDVKILKNVQAVGYKK